jgi:hypothetical protein
MDEQLFAHLYFAVETFSFPLGIDSSRHLGCVLPPPVLLCSGRFYKCRHEVNAQKPSLNLPGADTTTSEFTTTYDVGKRVLF